MPEVTTVFQYLSKANITTEDVETSMPYLERFVVLLYDRTSSCNQVDMARQELFTQKSRSIDRLPPTRGALLQHIKWSAMQACIWGQALVANPVIPFPEKRGWQILISKFVPLWTLLPPASQVCMGIIRCGCKKGCMYQCSVKSLICPVQLCVDAASLVVTTESIITYELCLCLQ